MKHKEINTIKKIMNIFQASEGVIRPHFIEGGIKEKETKQVTFQKTLEL